MFVVVQRVLSPTTRRSGINAFLYLHPNRRWVVPPTDIPTEDPGKLERKSIALEPNGNLVRSNLDVVAPDDIELSQIEKHLTDFVRRSQLGQLPWEGVQGPCIFRIHMVPQIASSGWGPEVNALAKAGAALVQSARKKPAPVRSPFSR
jgi:hypothetical protein